MWTHPLVKYPRWNSGTFETFSVLGQKSGHWVPVCTSFLLVLRHSTSLYSLLSSCFKMVFGRAKWGTYEHRTSHIGHSRCEHNSILYLYPGTGSRVPSVDSSLVYFHGYKHFTFEWYKIWLTALFKVLNVATVVTLIPKNAQNYACWNPTDHITWIFHIAGWTDIHKQAVSSVEVKINWIYSILKSVQQRAER